MRISPPGRSTVPKRAFALLIGVAVALSAFATTASAAPIERSVYSAASAFTTECVEVPDGTDCTNSSLNAFDAGEVRDVCLSIFMYHLSPEGQFTPRSSKYGCAPVADGAFTFDEKGLSGATVSETTITLQVYQCDPSGCQQTGTEESVVSAAWTGTGDLFTNKSNSKFSFGSCSGHFHSKGASRGADANVTIDGDTSASPGMLFTSESKFRMTCT